MLKTRVVFFLLLKDLRDYALICHSDGSGQNPAFCRWLCFKASSCVTCPLPRVLGLVQSDNAE